MSDESWIKEFYPVDAGRFIGTNDWLAGLKHSLQKWTGLRPKNLAKHGLHLDGHVLKNKDDDICFIIASTTCALCVMSLTDRYNIYCPRCPLYEAHGDRNCDYTAPPEALEDEWEDTSPFADLTIRGNPEPMITLIEKAIRMYEDNDAG